MPETPDLATRLDADMKDAMKSGDKLRVGTIRRAGNRADLVESEEREMAVIEGYLPAQLDAAAIEPVVAEVIATEGASSPADMGKVMKAAMARLGGQADGKDVRAVAQRLLGGDR